MNWPGIEAGDHVLIHSSLRRTCQQQHMSPRDVLNSFMSQVGPHGTLLFPLFNFGFTKGLGFDLRATKSEMGILSEVARQHWQVTRTKHPIYSFAVLGAGAYELEDCDNFSGYGHDSPFAWLHWRNGKIAVLDLSEADSMTYYHHVEETLEVPYRFHKTFTGQYIDDWGHQNKKTYGLFIRKEGVHTQVNPMGEQLWRDGFWTGDRPGVNSGLRTIKVTDLFRETVKVINTGRANGKLYEGKTYEDRVYYPGAYVLDPSAGQDDDGLGRVAGGAPHIREGEEDWIARYLGDS